MAEQPPPRRGHPLAERIPALAELTLELAPAGLVVEPEPPVAMVDLRVDPTGPGAQAAGAALGVALPTTPNTWVATRDGQLIWLGPDEWLVTGASAEPYVWERELYRAVAGFGGAAVDISAQRASIRLRGRLVRELLSFGCALDLRPARFPTGSAAQTTLGLAGIVLLALDTDDYRLLVRQSFAGYLTDWLLDAAAEFRDDPDVRTDPDRLVR